MNDAEMRADFASRHEVEPLMRELGLTEVSLRCDRDGCTLRIFGGAPVIAESLDALQRWLVAVGRDSVTVEIGEQTYTIRRGSWIPRPRRQADAHAVAG